MRRSEALAATFGAVAAAGLQPASAQEGAYRALIAAAKAEGSVVVNGPPVPACRDFVTKAFAQEFGFPVTYNSAPSTATAARVRAERAAGKYSTDVFVAGPDTPMDTFLPSGWLDKVDGTLVAPDVIDPHKWKLGHLLWMDPERYILRTLQYNTPEIAVNTQLVKPGQLTQWKQLLDPKWKGKIVAKDPGLSGAGTSLIALLYLQFGPDFVKRLYKDQSPVISRDGRQAAQFLAQGQYAILLGPEVPAILEFQKAGYPIAPLFPTDAPQVLSGGYGLLCLANKAPHPNAAKLFINWLAGQRAQGPFAETLLSLSLRNDVTYSKDVPAWLFPQKGIKYVDTYAYRFVTTDRDGAIEKAHALLGE